MTSLAAWHDTGKRCSHPDGALFYQRAGQGRPLLLLHGVTGSSWDFRALWPALTAQWDVVAVDFMGHGFSDKPRRLGMSPWAHLDRLQYVLQELGWTEVSVLAHDFGAQVALAWASRQHQQPGSLPVHLRSLVTLNAQLYPTHCRPSRLQRALSGSLGVLRARRLNFRRFQQLQRTRFGARTQPTEAAWADDWHLLQLQNGHHRLPHQLSRWSGTPPVEATGLAACRALGIPLTLINGVEDPVAGAQMAVAFEHDWGSAACHRLPCGYAPHRECPEAVLSLLQNLGMP